MILFRYRNYRKIFSFHRLAAVIYGSTIMKQYVSLVLIMALIQFSGCDFHHLGWEKKLSRLKRYLNFPTGSTAVVSFITQCFIVTYTHSFSGTDNVMVLKDVKILRN
jgi:hypothetical protein